MSISDHRELRALEGMRDAQVNRIYWLLNEQAKRTLTADEVAELERLRERYRAGR